MDFLSNMPRISTQIACNILVWGAYCSVGTGGSLDKPWSVTAMGEMGRSPEASPWLDWDTNRPDTGIKSPEAGASYQRQRPNTSVSAGPDQAISLSPPMRAQNDASGSRLHFQFYHKGSTPLAVFLVPLQRLPPTLPQHWRGAESRETDTA